MPKALCLTGMAVSVIVLILFLLDLAIGVPFHGASKMMDILFLVSAGGVGFLSWATFREQD